MAPFLLLLFLLSEAASDPIVVTVNPGDDVILPCQAADSSISVVEWTRPDLKPDIVLLYRDGHLNKYDQHPSFKDRVELVDRDLKDRDVSLILKNVDIIDAGTYECRVISGDTDPVRTIRTVRLQVPGFSVVTLPGRDVILQCRDADSSIRAVKWSRPDLKPDTVLLSRDGHLDTDHQHPSFKDRVELVDRDLKDGEVSLTLKNVNKHDAGTYKCRVKSAVSNHFRLIRTIRLQVPDLIVVRVSGEDVILPCEADDSSIRVIKWSRPDLKPDTVFLYSDGHLNIYDQHPSFKDRVELVDRELKDGNVSLILKNVSRHHAGTYECGVKTGHSTQDTNSDTIRIIRIIRLQVPGSNSGHSEDGNSSPVGLIVGLAAGVLVLVAK
ncbi:coxsackievirus and adenovirus receptor-like isoform X1 [Perca flavescens]|uniref:coxsackievirus and adenovirus receptor-like isoform X1 n=1 Tax=Perca flavescens TaxID=8167 RepID=UPI00106E0A1B|nr:coxsackievirus and adenovirus receptor-like isoform X1 [Perca flavescens]